MAISPTVLTAQTVGGAAPWTTASVSPPSNVPLTLGVLFDVFGGGTLGTLSASGLGLNWVPILSVDFSTIATPTHRLVLFRALGTPSSGTITLSTSGGSTEKAAGWELIKWDGADTSGTDGSGAIVQSQSNRTDGAGSPNTLTVTLAALTDPVNNAVYALFGDAESVSTLTPGAGYTELTNINDGAGQDITLESNWKLPGTTTPSVSGASSFSDQGGITIEIKAATASFADAAASMVAVGVVMFRSPSTNATPGGRVRKREDDRIHQDDEDLIRLIIEALPELLRRARTIH